jgi:hypothetical protein
MNVMKRFSVHDLLGSMLALLVIAGGCGSGGDGGGTAGGLPEGPEVPATLDKGLLLALAQFEITPEGKVLPNPKAARLDILTRRDGAWHLETIEDPESNVFHKAMVYTPPGREPGILTLGGNAAAIKLWRKGPERYDPETVWMAVFGGKHNRMREAELAALFGGDGDDIAVVTHDQGVVAIVRPQAEGGYRALQIDRQPDTFVHEVEIGDLDGDGKLEMYATPSEPNKLDGTPQKGAVVRYVPANRERRTVVAELGTRHAKEILVDDVDGDGRDELYVSVEGGTENGAKQPVQILRYDADTDPTGGKVIATIDDQLCRFLTAGDIDGDGKKEMVAAAFKSGLWLLRPGKDPREPWTATSIDKASSGFEHAALLTDLDGDKRDELYVASDDQGEVRRYVWIGNGFARRTILKHEVPGSVFTWNIMPVPLTLVH